MASGFGTVHVEGLRELNRALGKVSADLKRRLRDELKTAAEPVRAEAERLAVENISNIGATWGEMRIGVTTRAVYVAPKARRRGGSPRPNLAGLLVREAMLPAVEAKEPEVVDRFEDFLDRLTSENGFWA